MNFIQSVYAILKEMVGFILDVLALLLEILTDRDLYVGLTACMILGVILFGSLGAILYAVIKIFGLEIE